MPANELHVVFGTGPLGMATARALLARGHRVRMINRRGQADAPAMAEVMRGNAYDPQTVAALCQGATTVYQCAQPAYHEWVTQFPPLQTSIIDGVAAVDAKLVVAE